MKRSKGDDSTVATVSGYQERLERWTGAARLWTHDAGVSRELAFYGVGGHEHWAVQANCTACAALAVLATAPEFDARRAGCSQELLLDLSMRILRYILRTHLGGTELCVSGKQWGHSWISALGLERLAHGVAALRQWLTDADKELLRQVMIAESDFLLEGYPVVGAIDGCSGRNKPESNIWNGSFLFRTATLYPDAPNAARWREKATALMLNGISVPSDAASDAVFNGRKLSEWHVGPNYTEGFGLNHHGYMNLGYMVICLSQIAMLHYFCHGHGLSAPAELYHHAKDLWLLVKSLTFDDGRLWRIGGDTRVRYCYCQDYAVPVWMLARGLWGDHDAERFQAGWLKLVASEQDKNKDGAFLSERLEGLRGVSPFYYTRLEGDRACSMSMGVYWLRQFPVDVRRTDCVSAANSTSIGDVTKPDSGTLRLASWSDEFHGAEMARGRRRLASWVWKAARLPCGSIVSADRSDLAEWQWNLAGRIDGCGCVVSSKPTGWRSSRFDGGFATCGSHDWTVGQNPGEGSEEERVAVAWTAMVALPDDATILLLQRARTAKPTYINRVIGFNLNIPNDLYNEGVRSYRFNGRGRRVFGAGGNETTKD